MSNTDTNLCGRPPRLSREPSRAAALANYRRNEHPSRASRSTLLACPRFAREVTPAGSRQPMCLRSTCPVCIRTVALRAGRAIALAAPDTGYRLSLVGNTWPEIRTRMTQVVRRLRSGSRTFQHVWHVEANPGGTGYHIHGWSWGQCPSPELLREAAVAAGMGRSVWLGAWTTPANEHPAIAYGMKAVLSEPLDTKELGPATRQFKELNGGRLLHASRGFYRDGADGKSIARRREAERIASAPHRRGRTGSDCIGGRAS